MAMEKPYVLALAAVTALGVVGYLARGEGRRERHSAKLRDTDAKTVELEVRAAELIVPPHPARSTPAAAPDAPRAEPATNDAPAPAGEAEDTSARSTPIAVALYQHATHDTQFPGERWTIGEGRTEAGRAFPANEVSAIDVPAGVIVALFDTERGAGWPLAQQPERVELGAGLHNLAPYEFNDRVDALDVRRIQHASPTDTRRYPAHATLTEQPDGLESRLGRIWSLRLTGGAATQLFAARDGAYEDGAARGLWVPARFEVLLFAEPDGRGPAFVLGPGCYDLEHLGLTQRARSVRVLRVDDSSAR